VVATLFVTSEERWGEPLQMTGKLEGVGSCPATTDVEDVPWELWRSDGSGDVLVQDGVTDELGLFRVRDLPPSVGDYEYWIRYPGSATHRQTVSARRTVTIEQPSSGVVDLRLKPWRVGYRQTTKLMVHLRPWQVTEHHEVAIYRTESGGGSEELWRAVTVDPDTGRYTGPIRFERHSSLRAVWAGDDRWRETEDDADAKVHVIVTGRLSGHFGRDGGYHLARPDRDLIYVTRVRPVERANQEFRLQHFRRGRWRALATLSVRPDRDGFAAVGIRGGFLSVGTKYRTGALHPGGRGINGHASKWAYIRVVAGRTAPMRLGAAVGAAASLPVPYDGWAYFSEDEH
jgi:hypothetical protein